MSAIMPRLFMCMRAVVCLLFMCLVMGFLAPAHTGRAAEVILIKATTPMSVTGGNDIQRLQRLASGVNWDFDPDAATNAGLKRIGIKVIHLGNVDIAGQFTPQGQFVIGPSGQHFKPWQLQRYAVTQGQQDRLRAGLAACRAVGANPFVLIAQDIPPQLCLPLRHIPLSQRSHVGAFGPINWRWYRHYCQALFKYVMIDHGFTRAEFNVGGEPDGDGVCFYPQPPMPGPGSRLRYEAYFKEYEEVARAASVFEQKHPHLHLGLGGPYITVFTFAYGPFNWAVRFLRDCGRQKLQLNFLTWDFYGNQASLAGQYKANYPAFTKMWHTVQLARNRYDPSVPIMCPEWGANYLVGDPRAICNGDNLGAAWAAAFLDTMLQCGATQPAMLLTTTDPSQTTKQGQRDDVWSWPSLFTSPAAFGRPYPKALYNVLAMIHRLVGTRVEALAGRTVPCIASADKASKRLTVLLWNYHARMPESAAPIDYSSRQSVVLRIRDARAFFGGTHVRFKRWLVSRTVSNAYYLWKHGKLNAHNAALQQVDSGEFQIVQGRVDIGFAMPPSSVSLVEVDAQTATGRNGTVLEAKPLGKRRN